MREIVSPLKEVNTSHTSRGECHDFVPVACAETGSGDTHHGGSISLHSLDHKSTYRSACAVVLDWQGYCTSECSGETHLLRRGIFFSEKDFTTYLPILRRHLLLEFLRSASGFVLAPYLRPCSFEASLSPFSLPNENNIPAAVKKSRKRHTLCPASLRCFLSREVGG